MIDLDEINLTPDRVGSARKSRNGRKQSAQRLAKAGSRPKWIHQLVRYKQILKSKAKD
jgi:hypothetical protein